MQDLKPIREDRLQYGLMKAQEYAHLLSISVCVARVTHIKDLNHGKGFIPFFSSNLAKECSLLEVDEKHIKGILMSSKVDVLVTEPGTTMSFVENFSNFFLTIRFNHSRMISLDLHAKYRTQFDYLLKEFDLLENKGAHSLNNEARNLQLLRNLCLNSVLMTFATCGFNSSIYEIEWDRMSFYNLVQVDSENVFKFERVLNSAKSLNRIFLHSMVRDALKSRNNVSFKSVGHRTIAKLSDFEYNLKEDDDIADYGTVKSVYYETDGLHYCDPEMMMPSFKCQYSETSDVYAFAVAINNILVAEGHRCGADRGGDHPSYFTSDTVGIKKDTNEILDDGGTDGFYDAQAEFNRILSQNNDSFSGTPWCAVSDALEFLEYVREEILLLNCDSNLKIRKSHGVLEVAKQILLLLKTKFNDISWFVDAARYASLEVMRFLLQYETNGNQVDRDGFTALMAAAQRGRLDVVKMLLQAGANIDIRNHSNYTALDYAIYGGFDDIIVLLTSSLSSKAKSLKMFSMDENLIQKPSSKVDKNELLFTPPQLCSSMFDSSGFSNYF